MAYNWTLAEAYNVLCSYKEKDKIMDIGKRFPLTFGVLLSAKDSGLVRDLVQALPASITARKVEAGLKEFYSIGPMEVDGSSDTVDGMEEDDNPPKATRGRGRPARKAAPAADSDYEDDEDEEEDTPPTRKAARGRQAAQDKRKSAKSTKDDYDFEDDDEDEEDEAPARRGNSGGKKGATASTRGRAGRKSAPVEDDFDDDDDFED